MSFRCSRFRVVTSSTMRGPVGPQGVPGATGATGATGPAGAPGTPAMSIMSFSQSLVIPALPAFGAVNYYIGFANATGVQPAGATLKNVFLTRIPVGGNIGNLYLSGYIEPSAPHPSLVFSGSIVRKPTSDTALPSGTTIVLLGTIPASAVPQMTDLGTTVQTQSYNAGDYAGLYISFAVGPTALTTPLPITLYGAATFTPF